MAASPGRLFVPCVTVTRLVNLAYIENGAPLLNGAGLMQFLNDESVRIKGGPAWGRSEKFTIEAAAAGTTDPAVLKGAMLRTLLEERFQLKVHRVEEEVPMYALTVAKGGLKIQPIGPDGCTPRDPSKPSVPIQQQLAEVRAGGKPVCGTALGGSKGAVSTWDLGGQSLANLASLLAGVMDRHVLDRTGVTGTFNLHFEYAPDATTPSTFAVRGGTPTQVSDSTGSTIFIAMDKQLGLKLEPTKGPREIIVIDRVERPTPDGPARPAPNVKPAGVR